MQIHSPAGACKYHHKKSEWQLSLILEDRGDMASLENELNLTELVSPMTFNESSERFSM